MVAAVVYGFSFNKTKGKTMRIFNCGRKYVEGHLAEILADEGLFVVSVNGSMAGNPLKQRVAGKKIEGI